MTAALRAPSAHNAQPWRLARVDERSYRLRYAFEDRLRADPDDRDGLLAVGGFYETLRLAAEGRGLAAEFDFGLKERADGLEVGTVTFQPLQRDHDSLASSIEGRRCNRNAYERRPLPAELVQALQNSGHVLLQPDDVAPLVGRASTMSWQDLRFVADIRQWTRLDNRARDGMTVDSLQINPLDYVGLRFVLLQRRLPGFLARIYAARDVRLTRAASAMAILTIEGRDPRALFEAGRRLIRSWTLINAMGWAWHPMSVVIDQPTVRDLQALIGGRDPVAIYRVGFTSRPPAPSGRRTLADILLAA